jgi:hypothetical protein
MQADFLSENMSEGNVFYMELTYHHLFPEISSVKQIIDENKLLKRNEII